MSVLRDNYINSNGEILIGVKELAFTKDNIFGNLGKFVTETKYEASDFIDMDYNLNHGVYIYKDFNDSKIGYRIYKEFADYNFNGYKDDILTNKLQMKQANIKLTKLPIGVVTLDGRIIGQIISFFEDCMTLFDFSKLGKSKVNYVKLYIDALKILKELYDNGILYLDIHPKNFMIDEKNNINLIDFQFDHIKFMETGEFDIKKFFDLFNSMLKILNRNLGIEFLFDNYINTYNFDDTLYQLDNISKKLVIE